MQELEPHRKLGSSDNIISPTTKVKKIKLAA